MANFVFKGIQQVKALPASPEKGVLYFVREFANGEATGNMSVYFGSRCYGKVEETRLAKIESDILSLDGRVGDIEDALGNWVSLGKDLETVAKVVANHESRIVIAEGNASAAVATANSAKTIADEAKQIAEGAVTDVTEQVNAAKAAQAAAESARTDAAGSASAAAQSAADAEDAKGAAVEAQGLAEDARDAAVEAQGLAETAQGLAEDAKGAAVEAQGLAETAQGLAEDARDAAVEAQGKAEDAKDAAVEAQGLAETARDAAVVAQGKAETARDAAVVAQGKAETAQGLAETAKAGAEAAQSAAAQSAANADTSAQAAAKSASAADTSAQAAAGSASAAEGSAADAEAAKESAVAAKEAAEASNTSATAIANEAKDIADGANTVAGEAKSTAAQALETAQNAVADLKTYTVKKLSDSEVTNLGDTNVREAYQIIDEDNSPAGETIKIYKDSSLKKVELSGQSLQFTYILADGSEDTVGVDVSSFLAESEFGDGLQVVEHVVSVKKDASSESFLSVSSDGVKISGIQNAINTAASNTLTAATGYTDEKISGVNETIASIQSSLSNVNVKSDDKTVVITKTEDKAEFDVAVNTKVLSDDEKTAGYIEFLKDNNGALYGVMYYGGDDAE